MTGRMEKVLHEQKDIQNTYRIHVVPHTHWDREWHRPHEWFRGRLVRVIDEVLEILENDERYVGFTLDGQTIVLEDYLAVKPENFNRIRALVERGKLSVGPWYVLADEFLVSPESLVRNLLAGSRQSALFGARLNVGYSPDSFGHISQLPLLIAGFGMNSIIFERGVGDEGEHLGSEFLWKSVDGDSTVFAVHLVGTYSSAAALGHADWELEDRLSMDRAQDHVFAVLEGTIEAEALDIPEWLRDSFVRTSGGMIRYTRSNALLLLNGSDHLRPQRDLPEVLQRLNQVQEKYEFVHSNLTDFIQDTQENCTSVPTYTGEFRGSRYQHILSGVLSARMYLKQKNAECELLLERYGEPMALVAALAGIDSYPQEFLAHLWRILMQNHPHDSICGCSIDRVHDEMMTRFRRVHDGFRYLTDKLASGINQGSMLTAQAGQQADEHGEGLYLTVFNPHPEEKSARISHRLNVSPGHQWNLTDCDGNPVAAEIHTHRELKAGFSDSFVDEMEIAFMCTLAPLSFTSFLLQESDVPHNSGIRRLLNIWEEPDGSVVIQNVTRTLRVGRNGVLSFLKNGNHSDTRTFQLYFSHSSDAGDEYDFSPFADSSEQTFLDPVSAPTITKDGAFECRATLVYELIVPAGISDDRLHLTGKTKINATIEIGLQADNDAIELKTNIDNTARDQRLRFGISTDIDTDFCHAEGHWDILGRTADVPETEVPWFQVPSSSSYKRRAVWCEDGEKGIAITALGLPEYEARPGKSGLNIQLTLLRSVGWLSRNDLQSRPQSAGPNIATPGAQCIGRHSNQIFLFPYVGVWEQAHLMKHIEEVIAAPMVVETLVPVKSNGIIEFSDDVVLSALKKSEQRETVIARLWNPNRSDKSVRISLLFAVDSAFEVRLDESRISEIAIEDTCFTLHMRAGAVRTVELVPCEIMKYDN